MSTVNSLYNSDRNSDVSNVMIKHGHGSIIPSLVFSICPSSIQTNLESTIDNQQTPPNSPNISIDRRKKKHRRTSSATQTIVNETNSNDSSDEGLKSPSKISRSRSFNLIHSLKMDRYPSLRNLRISFNENFDNRLRLNSKSSVDSNNVKCLKSLLLSPEISQNSIEIQRKFNDKTEEIEFYQQRKRELDRVIEELIKVVKRTIDNNLERTSTLWIELKSLCVDKFNTENGHNDLFEFIFQTNHEKSEFIEYLKVNTDIQAALQVLKTTIFIMKEKFSPLQVKQLFDDEEKYNRDRWQHQIRTLVRSYQNSHQLIKERIIFYQDRSTDSTNQSESPIGWTDVVRTDYSPLIEKISNDFVTKIVPVAESLVAMLINVKKRLILLSIE